MTRRPIAPSDTVAINATLVAVRQTADAICDRWSLTLVWAALQGETRFGGFTARTGMATRLLSDRLRALEALGVMHRTPYSLHPLRHEYRLNPMGEALADALARMARWEADWTARTGDPSRRHPPTDHCAACGAVASARDIDLDLSEAQLRKMPPKQSAHRRSTISGAPAEDASPLSQSLAIFGDKWGIEIIICAFFRVRRFGDFRLCAGIAPNILSDRLDRLVSAGVLAPSRAPDTEPGYWLTEKGIDLYGVVVSMQDWADAWLSARYRSPVRLIHRGCGAVFHPMRIETAKVQ